MYNVVIPNQISKESRWLVYACIAFSMFVNCPTVICSPSMLSIVRRATSSELWTPILFFYIQSTNRLLICVYFLQTITSFHSICLILCFQKNRWDWKPHYKLGAKFYGCVVQVSTLLLALVVRSAKAQLATPLGCFLAPTGLITLVS